MRYLIAGVLLSAAGVLFTLGGCREIPSDKLYVLKLEQPPGPDDWAGALPHLVTVRGGRPHRMKSFIEVDEDTVHATTASCHHGARLPEPIEVDLRAFYTESELFIRLSWPDATPDRSLHSWVYDGEQWSNRGDYEDGVGILWDARGRYPEFSCSYACHIRDFGVNRSSFHASNTMRLVTEDGLLDLWNWKAARTDALGFADDRYLDKEGMHGDVPGEIFLENSWARQQAEAGVAPFGDDDRPLYDSDRTLLSRGVSPPAGSTVPGYFVEMPSGSRADVVAESRHVNGRWVVILRRALNTGDARDVVFVPGDEVGVAFGLALMDHTLYEHYASPGHERLVLMRPGSPAEEQVMRVAGRWPI